MSNPVSSIKKVNPNSIPKVLLQAKKEAETQTLKKGKSWDKSAYDKGPWDEGHWANRK